MGDGGVECACHEVIKCCSKKLFLFLFFIFLVWLLVLRGYPTSPSRAHQLYINLPPTPVASKLYGVDATIIIFVFVLYCIVHPHLSPSQPSLHPFSDSTNTIVPLLILLFLVSLFAFLLLFSFFFIFVFFHFLSSFRPFLFPPFFHPFFSLSFNFCSTYPSF